MASTPSNITARSRWFPCPRDAQLEEFTQTALANLRYPLLAQAKLPAARKPAAAARAGTRRRASVFQHVIYIIKENRTYDQVLGDMKEGNGDADLCIFGERVTPNEHKFVRDFVLLDNTYCCGIIERRRPSMDRQRAWPPITWSVPSPAGRAVIPAAVRPDGRDALAYSPAGFIWDDALAHGKTVRDFGEFTIGHKYWKDSARKDRTHLSRCLPRFHERHPTPSSIPASRTSNRCGPT